MRILIYLIICFFLPLFSHSQNIFIKYIGNSDDAIMLTCHSIESLQTPTVLNKNNRFLEVPTSNSTTLLCNQITRNTLIYAAPNETIELDINNKGLLHYYCNSNRYRKLESEFINDCFEKFGKTEKDRKSVV